MWLLKNTALWFMVSGYFPLDNSPLVSCPPWNPSRAIDLRTFPPGKLPLDISPRTTTPRATSPYKIPLKKINLRTFTLWIITPEWFPSWTITPWTSNPHEPPSKAIYPWTFDAEWNSALEDYPWKIYRWRSKKRAVYTLQFRNFE